MGRDGAQLRRHSRVFRGQVIGDSLYLYGGYGGNGRLDDFFQYNFRSREWTAIEPRGDPPCARENNGVVVRGRCLYLFGGYNGTTWLNDFHEFDIGARRGGGAAAAVPPTEPALACCRHPPMARDPAQGRQRPRPSLRLRVGHPPRQFHHLRRLRRRHLAQRHARVQLQCVAAARPGACCRLTRLSPLLGRAATGVWTAIRATGDPPSIRSCPSWTTKHGCIYVFGGYDGIQVLPSPVVPASAQTRPHQALLPLSA